MQLQGQVVLITGAGSGIGKATALLLAREGARIGALGRSDDELGATVDAIAQAGGEALALLADISDARAMQGAVDQLAECYGRIDSVFANAGINGVWAPLEDLDPAEWQKTIDINLTGTFYTVKYALPYLKRQGGSVIITASVNGTRIFSNTGATAYSCTKAAQVAFAKMIAVELGPHNIRVNVICPGAIETEIDENTDKQNLEQVKIPVEFPQGARPLRQSPGSADQVAKLVLFLASEASDHITGTEIWIDGAESLLRG